MKEIELIFYCYSAFNGDKQKNEIIEMSKMLIQSINKINKSKIISSNFVNKILEIEDINSN